MLDVGNVHDLADFKTSFLPLGNWMGSVVSTVTRRQSRLAGEERVGHPLLPEARAGAMAADEADVVAERQQLVLDRTDQCGVAASRQVGTADRAVEQDIADMREA